jgi:hypothetical protein
MPFTAAHPMAVLPLVRRRLRHIGDLCGSSPGNQRETARPSTYMPRILVGRVQSG